MHTPFRASVQAISLCCVAALPLLASASSAPDTPAGPVFVIRADAGPRVEAVGRAVTATPGGGFVVATGTSSIYGYLYDVNGKRIGGPRPWLVADGNQSFSGPVQASNAAGDFAVAATQILNSQPGVTPAVGNVYRGNGSLVTTFTTAGSPILNTRTTGIALAASGAFVVAGEETGPGGVCNDPSGAASGGAWLAFFSAAGALQHALCVQNNTGPGDTSPDGFITYTSPTVGVDESGRVVLMMSERFRPTNPSKAGEYFNVVYSAYYNADGSTRSGSSPGVSIGGAQQSGLDSAQGLGLAVDPAGSFVVGGMLCSSSAGVCTGPSAIHAARYDSSGTQIGSGVIIGGTASDPSLASPSLATDALGRFVVSWQRQDDGSIHARRYDAQGQPLDSAFDLGSGPSGTVNGAPLTALDADGDLVAVWAQQLAGAAVNTVGRRFAGVDSVDLALQAISHPVKAQPGAPLSYVFAVSNTQAASTPTGIPAIDSAIGSASTIRLVDTLPPGARFDSASGANWSCASAAGVVTCSYGLLLPAVMPTSQLTINLTASTNAGTGTPSNLATVSALQFDADFANDSVKQPFKVLGLGVSPVSYAFAPRNLNQTSPAVNFTLGNYGSAAATIDAIAVSGDFAQSNNCPAALAVNQKCTIAVTFTPTVRGARSGTLSVNSGAVQVPLSGSGVNPGHAPTALTATPGPGRVTLSWTGTADAVSYNVYQGTSSGGEAAAPVRTGLTGTSTVITGLSNTTTYYFKVSAVSASGESLKSNEAHARPQ